MKDGQATGEVFSPIFLRFIFALLDPDPAHNSMRIRIHNNSLNSSSALKLNVNDDASRSKEKLGVTSMRAIASTSLSASAQSSARMTFPPSFGTNTMSANWWQSMLNKLIHNFCFVLFFINSEIQNIYYTVRNNMADVFLKKQSAVVTRTLKYTVVYTDANQHVNSSESQKTRFSNSVIIFKVLTVL